MVDLPTRHAGETERLQVQALAWEPAAHALLAELPLPPGASAVDLGCGPIGWLRALQRKVGPGGTVVGTDIDDRLLEAAGAFCTAESLYDVELVHDDLFASALPPASFDLVHARLQLATLGRVPEQLAAMRRLLRPGGWLVLEEADAGAWRVNPHAPATAALVELLVQAQAQAGHDFNAGRTLHGLLAGLGLEPHLRAHTLALPPGHPYLALPLQLAAALRARLVTLAGAERVGTLVAACEQELARPDAWGTSFTLVQGFARAPVAAPQAGAG